MSSCVAEWQTPDSDEDEDVDWGSLVRSIRNFDLPITNWSHDSSVLNLFRFCAVCSVHCNCNRWALQPLVAQQLSTGVGRAQDPILVLVDDDDDEGEADWAFV